MAERIEKVSVESSLAAGLPVFRVGVADALQPIELVVHFCQAVLGAAVGIDTGADGFHIRQPRLQKILADEFLERLDRLEGHRVR